MTEDEVDSLWECLYLDKGRIKAILEYVREQAAVPFVYSMLTAAAHTAPDVRSYAAVASTTGTLRTAPCRSGRRKRRAVAKNLASRSVDINSALSSVMKAWLDAHPGGQLCLPPPRRRAAQDRFGELLPQPDVRRVAVGRDPRMAHFPPQLREQPRPSRDGSALHRPLDGASLGNPASLSTPIPGATTPGNRSPGRLMGHGVERSTNERGSGRTLSRTEVVRRTVEDE